MARKPKKKPEPFDTGLTNVNLLLDTELVEKVQKVLAARGSDIFTYIRLQLRAFKSSASPLNLGDKLPFGKYAGEIIEDVCRAEPSYVEWLTANASSAKFDVDVLALLEELAEAAKALKKETKACTPTKQNDQSSSPKRDR